MSNSDLNDSDILKGTTFGPRDDKGRAQLIFVLPSGRKVTSTDWLVPEEVKGKVLIAWANAIRAEDALDKQEVEERQALARAERLTRESLSAAPPNDPAPAPSLPSPGQSSGLGVPSAGTSKASSSTLLPDDPRDLIESKLRALRIEAAQVADQLDALKSRAMAIHASISRWESVAASLGSLPPTQSESVETKVPSESEPSSVEPKRRRSSTRSPYRRRAKQQEQVPSDMSENLPIG